MPNLKQKIAMHNKKIRTRNQQRDPPGCNCMQGVEVCPLGGQCQMTEVIYKAEVNGEGLTPETYTGLTSQTFKKRYYGHTSSFANRDSNSSTTMSSYIWDLKDLSPRSRVQFPGHRYICAKLEDFALSAVEEWLAIQCDYSW